MLRLGLSYQQRALPYYMLMTEDWPTFNVEDDRAGARAGAADAGAGAARRPAGGRRRLRRAAEPRRLPPAGAAGRRGLRRRPTRQGPRRSSAGAAPVAPRATRAPSARAPRPGRPVPSMPPATLPSAAPDPGWIRANRRRPSGARMAETNASASGRPSGAPRSACGSQHPRARRCHRRSTWPAFARRARTPAR